MLSLARNIVVVVVVAVAAVPVAGQMAPDPTVTPPAIKEKVQPEYPQELKDAMIGGKVTVRVVVGVNGEVISVDQPVGPARLCDGSEDDPRLVMLRNSVIEAVERAKFSPAVKDGKPIRMTTWVSSTFDPYPSASAMKNTAVAAGYVGGKAKSLTRPDYPSAARAARVSGGVSVRIVINEEGKVFTAEAVSGHPLLRNASEKAACKGEFTPTSVGGKKIRVVGVVSYAFSP